MTEGERLRVSNANIRAFAVHVLTASGGAMALLALLAAARGAWPQMFLWLGLALIVDGVDGPLARRLQVAERLPRWSGDVLDLVIDFLTYAFVPAFAIAVGGLLPPIASVVLPLAIVITAGIYFADREMKMSGNYFRGFPALWNAAAFYLFLLRPPPWIGTIIIAVLLALTFAPFRFIHPVRVGQWRRANAVLLVLWAGLALVSVIFDLRPGPPVIAALCAIGLYFFAFGFLQRGGAS